MFSEYKAILLSDSTVGYFAGPYFWFRATNVTTTKITLFDSAFQALHVTLCTHIAPHKICFSLKILQTGLLWNRGTGGVV